MNMQTLPVDKLIPAEYNPRKDLKPGDPEYEKLKRSITEFGYVEPVIWNKTTGHIVGGHQRAKILIETGVTEIECVVVEMSEEKEKALNVALNKINGEWDKDKLSLLIADLQGADFDVSLTGFDAAEIDKLLDSGNDAAEDSFDVDAELYRVIRTLDVDLAAKLLLSNLYAVGDVLARDGGVARNGADDADLDRVDGRRGGGGVGSGRIRCVGSGFGRGGCAGAGKHAKRQHEHEDHSKNLFHCSFFLSFI